MNQTKAVVVLMTAPTRDEAENLAEILVQKRLAACVQILPEIKSVYRWQGKIARDTEALMMAKTTTDRFDELEKVVRENHSYEVPEIVAVPAEKLSAPYFDWLIKNVNSTDGQ
jgi:periplasmic divalent cation tolerance protein